MSETQDQDRFAVLEEQIAVLQERLAALEKRVQQESPTSPFPQNFIMTASFQGESVSSGAVSG